jgi:hypothetical protein
MQPHSRIFTSTAFTTTATSNTLVSGLSATVAGGAIYAVTAWGIWSTTQTSTTFGICLGGSGMTASFISQSWLLQTATAGTSTPAAYTTLGPTPLLVTAAVLGTAYAWSCSAIVNVNLLGSLQVHARAGGTAGGTHTVNTGSKMFIEQVG